MFIAHYNATYKMQIDKKKKLKTWVDNKIKPIKIIRYKKEQMVLKQKWMVHIVFFQQFPTI